MTTKTNPEYLKFYEGKTEITLSRSIQLSTGATTTLTMREPTVDDQIAAERAGTDGKADKQYMANLCMVTPEDIGCLPLRDFKRLKAAFDFFVD